ncbi:TPA: ribonuclease Z, partial [Staphylococcus aureus]|nr:ribonuclease Z [Staphylococcus aureus]
DIDEIINITFYEVNHVDTLKAFAVVLEETENDRQLIYSGDINNYDDLKEMFISMIYKNVSSIYLDFSLNNSPVHENSLENLEQIVELFENSNIYLMHLDNTIEEYEWNLRKHYSDKKVKVAK